MYIHIKSPVSLNFILSFFLVNGPQALYVNVGCLKCICGIHLSPANKIVYYCIHFILIVYFILIFYIYCTKII